MLHVNLVAHTTNVDAHNREGSRFESPNANIVWTSHLVLCVDAAKAAVVRSVRSNHDDLWQVKLSFSIIFSSNDHRSSFRRRWHVQIRWFFFHYKTIFSDYLHFCHLKPKQAEARLSFTFCEKVDLWQTGAEVKNWSWRRRRRRRRRRRHRRFKLGFQDTTIISTHCENVWTSKIRLLSIFIFFGHQRSYKKH